MKIGLILDDRVIWFGPRHYWVLAKTILALRGQRRKYRVAFK